MKDFKNSVYLRFNEEDTQIEMVRTIFLKSKFTHLYAQVMRKSGTDKVV